jgi:hypothetical protein
MGSHCKPRLVVYAALVALVAAAASAIAQTQGGVIRHDKQQTQQCADGDCAGGRCKLDKHLRQKIDVDVDVDVNAAPAAATPASKTAPKAAELSEGEKTAMVVLAFLAVAGLAVVVNFQSRVGGKSKS